MPRRGIAESYGKSTFRFFFFFHLSFKKKFIGVEFIYNVVLVSAVQQSDSVIHIHIFILFQILFPYRLLRNIE